MTTNQAITPERSREVIPGTFPGDLGIEITEVTDEFARGRMAVDRRHLHAGGFVHGGVWTALADTVAAWGTFRHLPPDTNFTTVELKTNVFAAASDGDVLTAIAEPLHVGRRTHVWQVRILREDRLMANFICTQMVLG